MLFGLLSLQAEAARPKAYDSSTGEFYLKTGDGLEQYTVDGSVIFRGNKNGSIPTGRDCGVVFSPGNDGEIIQITVQENTLTGGDDYYLLVYQGAIEKIGYNTSDGNGQSKYLPSGWTHKLVEGSAGTVIQSTSADGKLSFGFHSAWSAGSNSFSILVESVVPSDMEVEGVKAASLSDHLYRGARNAVVGGATITTSGINNPLTLNSLSFDMSGFSADNASNLRVYRGSVADGNEVTFSGALGSTVTVAPNTALTSGKNNYWLVADLNPQFVGNLPAVTLSGATIADAAATVTDPVVTVAVANAILMPAENIAYTIGDAALFYDDGGPNGKIGSQFSGSVTFVPATEGNKIKVEFEKFAIFNTSSTGLNDVFKFYNGREANEENLITTLLTEGKTVKSTADDGSMTVTLVSTTGVPADGWEAIVSEFLPGDMTLESITATAASSDAVMAGAADQHILSFDVKTNNQLNPLSLSGVNVGVANTTAGKVKVYALGETNTFSTANLVGEATVTVAGDLAIVGSYQLSEEHNWFAVAVDVNETANTGDVVTLTLNSVTVGGNPTAIADASASRSVENVFYHTAGTNVVNMYGEWIFTDTPASSYSTKYAYGTDDCIVTFKPAEAGRKAQISFSEFDVYYASSSYGTRATFEIYSGSSVNSDNLLWKVSSNAEQTTGPGIGKVLRSTAADGALTIKFNANTSSSYYTGEGWRASVVPFQDHEMLITDVTAEQTSTADITPGAEGQDLINFVVATEGTLSTINVSSLAFDTKQSPITKLYVLYSGDSSNEADAVAFGEAEVSQEGLTTVQGSLNLLEGVNRFWVRADVDGEAEVNSTVDVKLMTVNGEAHEADPEGSRTVKNNYILQSGDNGVIVVNRPLEFYDNGGPDGSNPNSFEGQVSFKPASADKVIKLTFNSFSTYSTHYFYVYNGLLKSDDAQIAKLSGTNQTVEPIVSSAEDGSLTVYFKTGSYGTSTGWHITVEQYEPQPLEVASVTSDNAAAATAMRNESDVLLAQVAVSVVGDRGQVAISSLAADFSASTSLADITDAKLWYTAKSASFVATQKLGEATAADASFAFDEPVEITEKGTYYFWITASIAADAPAGNSVAASATGIVADDEVVAAEVTAQGTTVVKQGLKGQMRVGASAEAQYATIGAAVEALAGGIEGPVEILIEDGTYAENVKVQNIPGASANSPIAFTSLSGAAENVIITGSGYSEPAYGEQKYGMFVVENTPYVTLDHLTFKPVAQTYPSVVHVFDRSRNFTLINSVVEADVVTSATSGISLVRTEAKNEEGHNNDYFMIVNNRFTGGYIPLYLGGTNYVALTKEVGGVVIGNTITNPGSKGIYIYDERDAYVEGNTIISTTRERYDFNGMDIARCVGATTLVNNTIVINQNYYSAGIYLRNSAHGDDDHHILIANNAVAITNSPSNSTVGIKLTAECYNVDVLYNSVNVLGTNGYAFAVMLNKTDFKNVSVKNNIFQTATADQAIYLYKEDYIDQMDVASNAYYTPADNLATTQSGVVADWIARTGETGSIVEQAEFLSESDLHLKSAGNMRGATPLASVTIDRDGNPRDATTPTYGAYEYADIVVVTPEIAEGYPTVSDVDYNTATVTSMWNVGGKLYATILAAEADAPTAEQLLALEPTTVVADTEAKTTFDDLTELTDYKAYLLVVSDLGVQSEIVATDVISTLEYIAPLALTIDELPTIYAGDEVNVTANLEGGKEPYTYEWYSQMGNLIGDESTCTLWPTLPERLTLTVTSADGQTITKAVGLNVYGAHEIADFEDNYIDETTHNWHGITAPDGSAVNSTIYSGSYGFSNMFWAQWSYWAGFALSNDPESEYDATLGYNQYRNATGGGQGGSSNFALAYASGFDPCEIYVLDSEDGAEIAGVWLNNCNITVQNILNGDGWSPAFTTGDYLKVTFTGDDEAGDPVEFYLADYREASGHYYVDSWTWVDLTPLGDEVKKITVTMQASNTGVPTYFALDKLGAEAPILGDINGDGVIDSADVSAILEIVLTGGSYVAAADIDGSGAIDSSDVSALLELTLSNN